MSASPIFPVRLQTSIVGRSELNFRVRKGNGCTLALIDTDYILPSKEVSKEEELSSLLTTLAVSCAIFGFQSFGDPYGNRTHVCGVRGRRLNRLTNGPHQRPAKSIKDLEQPTVPGCLFSTLNRSIWCTFRDSNPGHPD